MLSEIDLNNDNEVTIVELAKHFNVSLRTLRFYEQKRLISPRRVANNQRSYSQADIQKIDFIIQCRNIGMRIEVIKEVMDAATEGFYCPDRLVTEIQKQMELLNEQCEEIKEQSAKADDWLHKIQDEPSKSASPV